MLPAVSSRRSGFYRVRELDVEALWTGFADSQTILLLDVSLPTDSLKHILASHVFGLFFLLHII